MQGFSLQGLAVLGVAFATFGCSESPTVTQVDEAQVLAAAQQAGLIRRTLPDQDPGPPFYARIGLPYFEDGGWVAIPFYRPPSCVPADFNLMEFFHFPGPMGPGAFACPLLQTGHLLTEPDAPLGTFPRSVVLKGKDIPVWFVRAADLAPYRTPMAPPLTMAALDALSPLKGVANTFQETQQPREEEHKLIISASGRVPDGRRFTFHVTEIGFVERSIGIRFR
jgi:hypothetical protein